MNDSRTEPCPIYRGLTVQEVIDQLMLVQDKNQFVLDEFDTPVMVEETWTTNKLYGRIVRIYHKQGCGDME